MIDTVLITIDPDTNGGIAAFVNGELDNFIGVPDLKTVDGAVNLSHFLEEYSRGYGSPTVVIERQWARPTDGSNRALSLGYNYGAIVGIAMSLFDDVKFVTPQAWTKAVAAPKTKQERVREVNKSLIGTGVKKFLIKEHGIVDAILIGRAVLECQLNLTTAPLPVPSQKKRKPGPKQGSRVTIVGT